MTDKLLLKPIELAEAIGVSRARAYKLLAEGEILSVRIGSSIRVPVDELHRWVARKVKEAGQ